VTLKQTLTLTKLKIINIYLQTWQRMNKITPII
jgi:hypothetical protein